MNRAHEFMGPAIAEVLSKAKLPRRLKVGGREVVTETWAAAIRGPLGRPAGRLQWLLRRAIYSLISVLSRCGSQASARALRRTSCWLGGAIPLKGELMSRLQGKG